MLVERGRAFPLVLPLFQQAPSPQHLVHEHHQGLFIQPRHPRRRTRPHAHPIRKRHDLALRHTEKLDKETSLGTTRIVSLCLE